jgi:hypothetical protein
MLAKQLDTGTGSVVDPGSGASGIRIRDEFFSGYQISDLFDYRYD